jgi:hypothetical protein
MARIVIEMKQTARDQAESYGKVLTSATRHYVVGRAVHNPHHAHTVDFWLATNGTDPHGKPCAPGSTHVLLSPHASVISARPQHLDPEGPVLSIGDEVELRLPSYGPDNTYPGPLLGIFVVKARPLDNPILCPVAWYPEAAGV